MQNENAKNFQTATMSNVRLAQHKETRKFVHSPSTRIGYRRKVRNCIRVVCREDLRTWCSDENSTDHKTATVKQHKMQQNWIRNENKPKWTHIMLDKSIINFLFQSFVASFVVSETNRLL